MARQLAADSVELQPAGTPSLTDQMAVWLTARYLVAVQKLAARNPDGELDLKVLRGLCHDVVAVRRGDHSGARLKLEQDRLEREREKSEAEVIAHFQRWLKNPAVRDLVCQDHVSPAEREARLREIFGLSPQSPEPPVAAAAAATGSNPVKPGQTKSNPANDDPGRATISKS
jgi:hypothetical protein